jgi:hypothetical protein
MLFPAPGLVRTCRKRGWRREGGSGEGLLQVCGKGGREEGGDGGREEGGKEGGEEGGGKYE